ncbi:MAG: phosphatase PAP2 family protein [Parvibaculaceae bacterium]
MNSIALSRGGSLVSRRLFETLRLLAEGLRVHRLHYAVACLALVFAIAASAYVGKPFELRMVVLFSFPILLICAVFGFFMLAGEFIRLIRSRHEGSPTLALLVFARDELLAPSRIANILHATLFMSVFMTGFVSLKTMLPDINPFSWDPTFTEWDRALHFGIDPWRILQPLLGWPLVTSAFNVAYNCWFFVMFGTWVWQGFGKSSSPLGRRYLLAFLLTWLLGTGISGIVFASVGPCFYGRLIAGPDPFAPLMAYLAQTATVAPLWVLDTQNMLWDSYVRGEGVIAGISAMPSMHVGSCVLMTLLGFSTGKRWLGWAFALFGLVIFLGSVHLAWHYAIDGYAGGAIALFGWWLAGRLLRSSKEKTGALPRTAAA